MKLTNYIRDAFLLSAMADVPSVDYKALIETEVKKKYKELLKQFHMDKVDIQRLSGHSIYIDGTSSWIPGICNGEEKLFLTDEVKALVVLKQAQYKALKDLKEKLHGIAYGCTTRKQLVELLPEFEKYLPAEHAKVSNLPAISNVVGDFIRAGWPKNKQAAIAVAA